MIASLTEEAEAIGWYEQRMALEPDAQARAIMANAQGEEFKQLRDGPRVLAATHAEVANRPTDDSLHGR
jgi:EncFtn-like ferroxidase